MNNKFCSKKLYNGLLDLLNIKDKPFYYEDTKINDELSYRVFCYSLPGYMQLQLPFGKDTRGTMFLINHNTQEMIELVALPMQKFFAYGEYPETSKLDFSKAKKFYLKPDGSLLNTYLDLDKELKFKTKRVPNQKTFNDIVERVMTVEFKNELKELTKTHTVDCELTSPDNRVILEYKQTKLTVLKARNRTTGEYLDLHNNDFKLKFPVIHSNLVEELDLNLLKDIHLKNRYIDMKGIEGGVVEMEDGTLAKVKTMYYLTQNRFANIQDNKKRNRLLVEACLEETFDELRTLFHYRKRSEGYNLEGILKELDSIERQVRERYNPLYNEIIDFYNKHKELSIDEFTTLTRNSELKKHMSVLIPMKRGVKVNIKAYFLKTIGNNIKA